MNICLISQEYPPDTNWGGIATYTQVLARQLVAMGERVHVVTLAEGDEYITDDLGVVVHRVSRTPKSPVDVRALPELDGVSHWSIPFSQRVFEEIRDIHKSEPIDVIEAPETCAQALITFRQLHGMKKITRLHTPFFWIRQLNNISESPEHLVRDQLEKLQTEISTTVTSPTHAMAEVVAKEWKIEDIVVIPNFFNLKTYIPDLSIYEEQLKGLDYVLFFGRLEYRKGVQVLAEALPEILEGNGHLSAVFIGSDSVLNASSMKEHLKATLRGYEDRIHFIDNIPHASLYPIIERARLVVLPSLWENFPYACLETMALGKTVVTSDAGGFPEIIDDEVEGILCTPNDPSSLKSAILSTLHSVDTREVGRRAQEKVKVFDTATIVAEMLNLYKSQPPKNSVTSDARIAYILLHIPFPSETFILNEILGLQRLGLSIYPVSLFETTKCHEHLVEQLGEAIFDLTELPDLEEAAATTSYGAAASKIASLLHIPGKYAVYAAIVADHVVKKRITHLHAHFAAEASLVTLLVSRLTGIPFSFTTHAYDLFNINPEATGGMTLEERLSILMPAAEKIITISEFNRKFILDRAGDRYAGNIEIIRCGIDADRFNIVDRAASETVTFLCVGRLVEKKGHEYLFHAFQKATEVKPQLRLRLVGSGYLMEGLQRRCNELGISDKVTFLGDISSNAVNDEMKGADVFVLHSITASSGDMEGIPVSLMEASATGLPVLSTRHSGISELVIDGETGFLTDEKDVDTCARRMVELASEAGLRNRMGLEGRKLVKEKFSLFSETKKLGGIFQAIIAHSYRKLHIAFLTGMHSNPAGGGGNVHVHQVARGLLDRGHSLYTNIADESEEFTRWNDDDFKARGSEIDLFYIRIHGHPGNDELTRYRLCNPDAPCIWEVNAPLEELYTTGLLPDEVEQMNARRKELAQMVDAAVCVSSEMEVYAKRVLGIKRTFLIPNGSDPGRFTPLKRKDDLYGSKFTVLWSGSPQFPWQGHETVKDLARKMQDLDSDILFALTSEGKSEGNLLYLGKVPYDTMTRYMASADLGLCIYGNVDFYPEFFFSPLKLYDYMASALPVVGSDVGQIRSTLTNFGCGVVTDGTIKDMADKILYLKKNREVAGQMGKNGRDAVLKERNWSSVVSDTERAMMSVIEKKYSLSPIKVSVVICTYNRSDLLGASLEAVARQDFPAARYEIIVVDNNSSDDTRAVTEAAVASSSARIRYIFEENQGLSFARNAGIRSAEGEIVAFVDDDIDAEPGWLRAIVEAFDDPSVACAGGPIRPIWPGEKPEWLSQDWVPYLTVNEFEAARKAGRYTWPDTPWGANISFRKEVFDTVGLFPTNLGRIGNSLLSNEEVNICKKIAQAGLRIGFAPEAIIHHKIAAERTTKQWFYHRTYWQGRSDAILDATSGASVYAGARERIRRYLGAAREGAFTERCARRIALGYLYQAVFAGSETTTASGSATFRALLRYLSEQSTYSEAGESLPAAMIGETAAAESLAGKSILMIDYEVPQYDKYAGSRTTFMYLKLLTELGMKVYFLPDDFEKREPYTTTLEKMGIKVLYGEWFRDNWQQWIRDNSDKLHYVFFNRPNITVNYIDYIKAHTRSVILFQGHDLHYLRLTRKYEVDGDVEALREAAEYRKLEFDIINKSDIVLTYSDYERQVLAEQLPNKPIYAVPLFFYDEFLEGGDGFDARKDLMFVGGCGHKPNRDAILWFATEVFPKVLEAIPDAVFHVIGTYPPQEVRDLASDNIKVVGHVCEEELEEYYRHVKLAVVPLRFGAGVKGKTIEALYRGVPLVSTAIGLEGIPGIGAVIQPADTAEQFAHEIISIYNDNSRLQLASSLYREYAKTFLHSRTARKVLADTLTSVPVPDLFPAPKVLLRERTERSALPQQERPRLIAFYLPQYHPIAENDQWWGKGFTEWRNVSKAKPLFPGHYQPHIPADLGFYDLRLEETRIAQAELAREHGIGGFCYYHYWFNGKRLLEKPLEALLASGKPDFPFCICWANENWTRRWDGEDQHVLMEQKYSEEDDRQHIRSLFRVFEDSRYIRIGGKPLFLVYRTENLPNPGRTAEVWREEARKAGLGELFLARVEGLGQSDPRVIGFDAAIEFAPDWNRKGPRLKADDLKLNKWLLKHGTFSKVCEDNYVHSYDNLVDNMLAKEAPEYSWVRCVTPSWDNSARRNEGANIFVGSTPDKYQRWLTKVIQQASGIGADDDKLVFVNAWNEWAEGNHLEPDQLFGRAYLEATRNAVESAGRGQIVQENIDVEALRQLKQRVSEQEWQIVEMDRLLGQFQKQMAEKDAALHEHQQLLAQREQRIQDLLNSASWKATGPLRWSYEKLIYFKR